MIRYDKHFDANLGFTGTLAPVHAYYVKHPVLRVVQVVGAAVSEAISYISFQFDLSPMLALITFIAGVVLTLGLLFVPCPNEAVYEHHEA